MDFKGLKNRTQQGLRSAKGRNFLTFLTFLCISTVFWFLLALNDEVQSDYRIPVTFDNFPQNVVILTESAPVLNAQVKDKGATQIRFSWGATPQLKLHFDDFTNFNDTVLLLPSAQLHSAVRNVFGPSATVLVLRPDSLKIPITRMPGIKMPVEVVSEVHTRPSYSYSGHPILSQDSVVVYSNSGARFKMSELKTETIVLSNLSDTATVEAHFKLPSGMRAIPSSVTVKFPVEPLVAKQQSVPIEVVNVPHGIRLITFPSMADVTYLIPKSLYSSDVGRIRASVDYRDITDNRNTLSVSLSKVPVYYHNVTVHPEQVEFVVESTN